MATLLLIVRWAVALLLVLCVAMMPSVWKDRHSEAPSRSTGPILILMAGVFGSAAYCLITASWTPLLVTLQMGFGLGMIIIGLMVSVIFYRDKRRDAITPFIILSCLLLFTGISLSVVLLRWHWLLMSLAGLVLGVVLAFVARAVNSRNGLRSMQQLAIKTRGIPMTISEAKERLGLGEEIAVMSLLEEERLGRVMNVQELVKFAEAQRSAFKEIESEGINRSDQLTAEFQAEEQEKAALEALMKTDPAATRTIKVHLAEKTEVSGQNGEQLLLPAGEQELCLKVSLKFPPEDDDGFPVIFVEITTATGAKVNRQLLLPELIELTHIQSASYWKSMDHSWRRSFSQNVLLESVECTEDDKEWKEIPIGDEKIAFYSRSGSLHATLSVPSPHDLIWCRIHGLNHMDSEDEDNEFEWKTEEAFCFPLSIETFLKQDNYVE